RAQLPAVARQVDAAVERLLAADTEHHLRVQIIADRQLRLRTEIGTYLGQLDGGAYALARATLESSIEPLTDVLTNDLLSEQNDHLASYAVNQASTHRDSRWLAAGSLTIFVLGLVVLALFGWSSRTHRR